MQINKTIVIALLLFVNIAYIANSQLVTDDFTTTVDNEERYGSLLMHRAMVKLSLGMLKTAEIDVLNALKKYEDAPTYDIATFIRANIDFQDGNHHIALAKLEHFIAERSNSPFIAPAYLFCGYISLEIKDYSAAQMYFINASNIAASDIKERNDKDYYTNIVHSALYWIAISYCHQGKYIEAKPYFEKTSQEYKELNFQYAAAAIYALGTIAEKDKNYQNAIKYYEKIENEYKYSNVIVAALIRHSNDDLLLRNSQSALLNIQKVENIYKHIADKDSIGLLYKNQEFVENYNENLLYLKGEALNNVENYDQAITVFKELIQLYPHSELIRFANMGLGWSYLNKENYEEALLYYEKVINSKDINDYILSNVKSLAYLNKITVLKKLGRKEEAQYELSMLSVKQNFPHLDFVQLELGQIYYENGDYDLARKTLERAEREANSPKVQIRIATLLGETEMELKQYAKAVNSFKKTINIAEKADTLLIPNKSWYLMESLLKQGIASVLNDRSNDAITVLLRYIGSSTTLSAQQTKIDEALFWLGEAYYRSDMLKNAGETFGKLIDNHPTSKRKEEALYGMGWSYFRMAQFNQSATAFDRLVKDLPKSKYATEVLTRQADGYYSIKNYAKASEYYARAAKQGPDTEEGQYSAYQLAHTLYRQSQYEKSITAALNFVKNYPKASVAPNALYLIAWIRFQQERYNECIENFYFLMKTYPQSDLVPRSYFAIADAYYNMGNFEEAMINYNVVVEQYPSDVLAPDAYKSIQQTLIALDREDEAIQIANNYISNNPTSPFIADFQYKKAEMFYTGHKYKDAVDEYNAFITKYPDNEKTAEALYWLGKAYSDMNDFDNASKAFLELHSKFSKNDYAAVGLLEYGLLLKQQNMIDSAQSIFSKIEVEFPTNNSAPQAGFERAILYFAVGDTLNAITQFKEVADKHSQTDYGDQSRYRVAMYYRFKQMNEAAITEFSKIAEVYDNPTISAEARYRIGELYLTIGNIEKAKESFEIIKEKFAGYDDWFSMGMLGLGSIYEKEGLVDEAREIYYTVQQIHPTDEFGKTAEQRLKRMK